MQDRIADRPLPATRVALKLSACAALSLLAGCASTAGGPAATFLADPGKYQFSSCEQLAKHRQQWSSREQELRLLMDRAEQSTGGAFVNVLAYKADYVAASEELKVVEDTARTKNCNTPQSWQSNSVVR